MYQIVKKEPKSGSFLLSLGKLLQGLNRESPVLFLNCICRIWIKNSFFYSFFVDDTRDSICCIIKSYYSSNCRICIYLCEEHSWYFLNEAIIMERKRVS